MQAPLRLSARLQQRAERRVFGQAAKTVVCSATEVPLAKDISPNANVGVVANGWISRSSSPPHFQSVLTSVAYCSSAISSTLRMLTPSKCWWTI